MDAVERLIASEEIRMLVVDYAASLDANEPERMADIFAEDCAVEYFRNAGQILRGPDELIDLLRRAHNQMDATCHFLGNFRVDFIDDDHAEGSVYVRAWHRAHEGDEYEVLGRYDDRYVRTGAGWRIMRRVLRSFDPAGDPDGSWLVVPRSGRNDHA